MTSTEHFMSRMDRPPAPEGHHVVIAEEFERIAFANRARIDLPGPEGGWATCQVGGQRFATWQRAVPLELKAITGEGPL